MVVKKTVVARVIDPYVEISEEAAHRISKRAKIGDVVSVPVETKQFGRIAAQAAKQVIIQGIPRGGARHDLRGVQLQRA